MEEVCEKIVIISGTVVAAVIGATVLGLFLYGIYCLWRERGKS